jgi:hypothetical protein
MNAEPPNRLWHYTSIDGAVGIIKTQTLFATPLRYLNDSKEFHYAAELFIEDVTRRTDSAKWGVPEEALPDLKDAFDRIGKNICVVSFCTDKDLLSQWRAYGRDQRGIALGFDSRRLSMIAGPHGFKLIKCLYDYEEQRAMLFDQLSAIAAKFRTLPSDNPQREAARREVAWELAVALTNVAPYLKHRGFAEEKEYRLIGHKHSGEGRWDVHRSGTMLASHFLLPIRAEKFESPFAGVVIGAPNSRWQDVAEALDVVFRQYAGEAVLGLAFEPSWVPYRGAG